MREHRSGLRRTRERDAGFVRKESQLLDVDSYRAGVGRSEAPVECHTPGAVLGMRVKGLIVGRRGERRIGHRRCGRARAESDRSRKLSARVAAHQSCQGGKAGIYEQVAALNASHKTFICKDSK